ncbi:M4 family metallopeptidase [Mycolicibacterium stellerae]|uniref:M4 family metallopeptidase n=1 Tax=Mycolicibacterium stellerae TaxID=2358193 RepID=UPI000F0B22C6|nr:M4 family metallopeptidase [Mycolicibacterium stellerae]
MTNNGLNSFSIHSEDEGQAPAIRALNAGLVDANDGPPVDNKALDPETAARRYLSQMIESPRVPAIRAAEPDGAKTEFRTLRTETVPLTDTTVVKFTQYRKRIPVYGSMVTIELDENNEIVGANGGIVDEMDVEPVAKISPERALKVVCRDAGINPSDVAEPPKLYYFFDNSTDEGEWRLCYITTSVPTKPKGKRSAGRPTMPQVYDYVIDAHTGKLVAKLPRAKTATWTPEDVDLTDGLGRTRRVRIERNSNGKKRLRDSTRNIETYDFKFKRIEIHQASLPGQEVGNPPDWNPSAVSAHANAQEVVDFLLNTLKRNGLDGSGGQVRSSINCTSTEDDEAPVWRNAAWFDDQMVYGQRDVDGELLSYAVAKDVVAHELVHGLTDNTTAQLVYENESGALNESYSDILGTIIANHGEPNIAKWNWEFGEDLDGSGVPLRDLSDPTLHGDPDHMDDYVDTDEDYGGVHTNSGIHNKAAFNVITARKNRRFVFTPDEVAALFYLALSQYLRPTSGFSDSRRAVESAAKTLFRRNTAATKAKKLTAIAAAFDAVGITG